jgi:hypothetical protein
VIRVVASVAIAFTSTSPRGCCKEGHRSRGHYVDVSGCQRALI